MSQSPGRILIVSLGRSRGSLAAARALHRAGWVVGIGTPDGGGMITATRACSLRHEVPRPRGDGRAFIDGVRAAVDRGGYDVVFGGADDWMSALATYRTELPVLVAHPEASIVDAALDKVSLARRASDVGLLTPHTVVVDDDQVGAWRGPVVVKCRTHWFPGQQHATRIEARMYPDIHSALDRIATIRSAGFEPILQRPVQGVLSALIGLVHAGRLVGRVQQVTSRLWPTPSGVSSRAETVPVDDELADRCEQLVVKSGWSGLVELQFLTAEGGEPHLIDFNGRFYGSMALANAAGPNLADAWARQVLGRALPPLPDGRAGVRYLWTAGDLRRATVERRGGLGADVFSTVRWGRGAATSVWDPRDVGPAMHLVTSRGRRLLRGSRD